MYEPKPKPLGLKVTWQAAVPPLPERVQLSDEKEPALDGLTEKVTEPVGVIGVPPDVSVTVTVHVGLPKKPDEQLTVTLTARCVAEMVVLPELPKWEVSPG